MLALSLALLVLDVLTGHAQQLSIRRYDVSDGLAHNTITSIYQDAKGYLWFGTFEGLSRFDGYRFTNYSTSDGLGHVITNYIAEDRQGRLWVATNGGLVKYQNGQQTECTTAQGLSVNWVRTLAEDGDSNLWIGTEGGGAMSFSGEMFVSFTPADGLPNPAVLGTFEDRDGRLRAMSGNSLVDIASGTIRLRRQLDSPPVSADSFLIYYETP